MDKVTVTTADVECVKAMIAKTSFSRNGASPSTSACEIAARHRIESTRQAEEQIKLLREALEDIAGDPYQHGQRIQRMKKIAAQALQATNG